MPSALLTDRRILSVSGDDRISFLQGLISNDANQLTAGNAIYAAMLTPQGKFLHDFFLIPHGDAILVDINNARAEDFSSRLNRYKLRSKITISSTTMHVAALWTDNNDIPQFPNAITIQDPRYAPLGKRIYVEESTASPWFSHDLADYEAYRLTLGIPDGAKDMTMEKSLLMEFGFEALHGVSFSKGCYVGQEVTARSKFRGHVRKSLYQITANTPLPATGTEITNDQKNIIGELLSISGNHGLALLKTEMVETSSSLIAGDVIVSCHLPVWLTEHSAQDQ